METEFVSVSVKKYAGGQEFSVELLDRSSPAFFDELVRQMEYAYAKATDVAVITGLIAGGTDGGNRTMSAANLLDFVSDAGVSIYAGTLGFAQNIIASPQQWGAIQNLADNGRPIYQNLIGNMNQGGAAKFAEGAAARAAKEAKAAALAQLKATNAQTKAIKDQAKLKGYHTGDMRGISDKYMQFDGDTLEGTPIDGALYGQACDEMQSGITSGRLIHKRQEELRR